MSIRDAITLNGQPLGAADLIADDLFEWQLVDIACTPLPGVVAARLSIGSIDLGSPTIALGEPVWRWRWMPREAVGVFHARLEFTFADSTIAEETFSLRIRPRTIDSEQYEELITAVQRDAAALVYAWYGGSEGVSMGPDRRSRWLLEDYHVVVDQLVPAALKLTKELAPQPHQMLRKHRTALPLSNVDHFDQATLAAVAQTPPDVLSDDFKTVTYTGPLPQTVSVQHSLSTTDVIEHRVLKGILDTLQWQVGLLRGALSQEVARRAKHDALRGTTASRVMQDRMHHCAAIRRALRQALASSFLAGITPVYSLREPTQLMRRSPRYRRVYDLYRSLRSTPLIDWDSPLLWLPIQSLPLLYEQWCVLQIVKLFLPLGTLTEQQMLLSNNENGQQVRWTLRLRQNVPLVTIRRSDGAYLRLFYQRRYVPDASSSRMLGSLDPFVRIPDIAIEITHPSRSIEVLLLDAKYRVAENGSVPQDALDDAYAYRNAIGVAGRRATLGAFLLYPGSETVEAADWVGALPCLPREVERLETIQVLLMNNSVS